jgi:hypothetical protein
MKLFFKRIIVFIPVLSVTYLLLLFVVSITPAKELIPNIKDNTGGKGYSLLRLYQAERTFNPDILFLGSSHARNGFDNRIFSNHHVNTFNLGSGLQTPQNSFFLLEHYAPLMQPKKIIMELYWDVLEYENGTEACIDITSNSPLSSEIIKMNLSTREFKVINSMLSIYIRRLIYPLQLTQQQAIKNDLYVSGGYIQTTHSDDYTKNSFANLQPRSVQIKKKQLEYIQQIIRFCNEHQIPLSFVTAPVPQPLLNNLTNYPSIITEIQGALKAYNSTWINFNDLVYREQMQLNDVKDFNDLNHLSQQGTEKFNLLLIQLLKEKKL